MTPRERDNELNLLIFGMMCLLVVLAYFTGKEYGRIEILELYEGPLPTTSGKSCFASCPEVEDRGTPACDCRCTYPGVGDLVRR